MALAIDPVVPFASTAAAAAAAEMPSDGFGPGFRRVAAATAPGRFAGGGVVARVHGVVRRFIFRWVFSEECQRRFAFLAGHVAVVEAFQLGE